MASGPKLDAAGTAKLQTLDDAILLLQRLNGLVELYALAVKNSQPSGPILTTFRRTLPSFAANIKTHFGLIAEQAVALNLSASRGASEAVRVRTMREGMALLKQALEIALVQTRARHTVSEEPRPASGGGDAT